MESELHHNDSRTYTQWSSPTKTVCGNVSRTHGSPVWPPFDIPCRTVCQVCPTVSSEHSARTRHCGLIICNKINLGTVLHAPPRVWEAFISSSFSSLSFITPTPSTFLPISPRVTRSKTCRLWNLFWQLFWQLFSFLYQLWPYWYKNWKIILKIILKINSKDDTFSTIGYLEILYLRPILRDVGHAQTAPTNIYEDNLTCISMFTNPVLHKSSPHMIIHVHFCRELYTAGDMCLISCHQQYKASSRQKWTWMIIWREDLLVYGIRS